MNSEWVKTELRKARPAELREQRPGQKLFPIRLVNIDRIRDWSCFGADSGKDLAVELREYHIPVEDFQEVVSDPAEVGESRSSGRPCCWGETSDGRYLLCVFEKMDEVTILPITAYETRRRGE